MLGKMEQKIEVTLAKVMSVVTLLLAFHAGSAAALTEVAPLPDQPPSEAGEPLEAFIEREMQEKMREFKVVGATLALVRAGEVIYARGFGDADVEAGRKVVAEETLFRWGSISKTFTWTAIMQLVERGKVSLEADVNEYLDEVSIPPAFDGPIRVKHLLSHTPGFEDGGLGYLFEKNPEEVLTLKDYLLKYRPNRVRPAGEALAYSNYGSALAGHIVENVTGMSFEDYLQANIFRPLDMTDTTFLEPLPEAFGDIMAPRLYERVSKGFLAAENGPRQIDGFTFVSQVAPAGAISSTAIDMAKFARAHLEDCALNGARILQTETCTLMHSGLLPLNAGGKMSNNHGFFQDYSIGGHDRLWHNGGTIFFHSQMSLYPDLDFAFLMSTNTNTGPQLYKHMEETIVKWMFGDNTVMPEAIEPPGDFAARADKYVGYYQSTRRNYSSIEVLNSLFQGSVKVTVDSEGYLVINSDAEPVKAAEVKPNLFRAVDKDEYFEFVEDKSGDVLYLKTMASHDKVAWHQAPENRLLLLAATLVFLGVGYVVLGIRSLGRFSRKDGALLQKARRRLLASLTVWGAFFVALIAGIIKHIWANDLITEFPSQLVVGALAIGIVACLVALLPTWTAILLWREKAWSIGWRCYYTLLVLAVWLLVAQLNAIHLLGFNYIN
ncbi:MAG: serine hydrolase domain-containing protein [Haliea sp.]